MYLRNVNISSLCTWDHRREKQCALVLTGWALDHRHSLLVCVREGWSRQALIPNRLSFRGIPALAGSCSHPRKIQEEKKFMEASRSLFTSVWGLSGPWEWVSIRGQSTMGWELSLLLSYLWRPPQVSLNERKNNGRGGQTVQRSLSFCMVLS